jgi:non-specific serine/threonine protein kinase
MKTPEEEQTLYAGNGALLAVLEGLSPGSIYGMAPRSEVLRGMELLRGAPVRDICWSRDRSGLFVEVADQRLFEVTLTAAAGELSHTCECGRQSGCSHLVSALVTLKKLLSPNQFADVRFSDAYRQELFAALTVTAAGEANANPLPFRLVVETKGAGISVRAWCGDQVATGQERGLSAAMRRFVDMPRLPQFRERIFHMYHELLGADAPVTFRKDGDEMPLRFEQERIRVACTVFDVSAGRVTVEKTLGDGVPFPEAAFASDRFYFDIPAGSIQEIADNAGWRLWHGVKQALSDLYGPENAGIEQNSRSITLDVSDFNRLALPLPVSGSPATIFRVNGSPAALEERLFAPALHISNSGNDAGEFRLLCRLEGDGLCCPVSAWPFGLLAGEERWRYSAPLRTKKRFATVVTACFDLLDCTTAKEESVQLRAALAGEDFLKRKVKNAAKQIITAFTHGCAGEESVLSVDDAGWYCYSLARREQALLLEIPFRIFGPAAFTTAEKPGELRVPREELLPKLPGLQAKMAEHGWRLLFNDKPLKTVKWEFTLDATRSSIDWFELKPEVRCDGLEVKPQELAEAMRGGGIYLKDGEFVMLDSATSALLAIFPAPGKGRRKNELVRIPRLQILDWIQLRKSGVTVRLAADDEQIFARLASFEAIPPAALPERLDATLRQYQTDGYNWLAFLYRHRFGACLADDMGLGKTIQAISLLAGLFEGRITPLTTERLPHLIVVPPSLIFNWESELARFYPALQVLTYRGSDRSTDFAAADVVLTSYGIVQRDADKLTEIRFHVIILDEAQAVKNIQTDTTGACRKLRGLFSLVLTGTPVENHLGEYYSVMDIAVPGLLGDYEAFRRRMNGPSGPFMEMLVRRTRPFILRRTKQLISAELPPKIETDIYLELTDKQKSLYTRTVAEVRQIVADAYQRNAAGQARIIALTAILRLRQLCLSPEILLPEAKQPSPKVEFLLEQLAELFDEGHSVLVFSQFTSFLNIVQRGLAARKLNFMRLDGSTPVVERKKLVNDFQRSTEPAAFLLSLKAGGKGLNLTRATYVFHLDPWWNPAVEDQASDRAHRIGQTSQVTITRLIMRHTIEEKMMDLKKRKLRLYKALLEDATSIGSAGISREDFDFLLG